MNTKIIAEGGINHNGDFDTALRLIEVAAVAGCNYIKFQKRNPDLCVPEEQKSKEKTVPWRNSPTTYLQYKWDIEFDADQYKSLMKYAEERGIQLFVSVWDMDSAEMMSRLTNIVKIPSAKITDTELLRYCRENFICRIMSTGMSTEEEIDVAVDALDPTVIMHTNSAYPTPIEELRLGYIRHLAMKFRGREIGYSSHYYGIQDIPVSLALGVTWVEKHITLNHNMWGSDQSSSVEPHGLFQLVKEVRDVELALERGFEERDIYPDEIAKRKSLRG